MIFSIVTEIALTTAWFTIRTAARGVYNLGSYLVYGRQPTTAELHRRIELLEEERNHKREEGDALEKVKTD